MATSREDEGLVFLGLAAIGFLLWSVIRNASTSTSTLHAQLTAWTEIPTTSLGAAARHWAETRVSVPAVVVGRGVVRAGNAARPIAALALALCALLGFYPRLAARFGHVGSWGLDALAAAAVFAGVAGLLGLLSVPLAWPGAVQLLSLVVAGVNVAFAAACLLILAQRDRGDRVLEHGPDFTAPAVEGPAVLIGRVDAGILPGHARWLARTTGDIQIPFSRLSTGIAILGEKGSGKSRLLFAVHDAIRAQYPDVPILIHDPKGEWYRSYFDSATDLYFAPHFTGSARWAVWQDFHRIPELRHALITAAIHAHPSDSGTFWMDQAVDMLEHAAAHENFSDAVAYLAGIPRARPDDRFLLSVFGTARLGFLDLAKAQLMGGAARSLSIDDFLQHRGRILLLNDPSCADQQRGVFSLFLTAFLLRVLSMPDVPAGTLRAVAIVDEALTFSLPPDVDRRIYALCRSKGLCIIAGAQRLPNRQNNERGEWQNAEYTVAMKVIDQGSQTALSKRAGSLLFRQKKTSKATHEHGASQSESEQDARQDAIPAEHFGRLGPREFVLFHDRGLITGKTVDVAREQRQTALPAFDPLNEVTEISRQMMLGG